MQDLSRRTRACSIPRRIRPRQRAGLLPGLLVAVAVLVAVPVLGTPAPNLDSIPVQLQALVDQGKIPGAVVLVARDGQLIHGCGCFPRVPLAGMAPATPSSGWIRYTGS